VGNKPNQEAIISALSSFLRAMNFSGKRDFLKNYEGLQFLIAILTEEGESLKMLKKVLFLLYDLVINDQQIFEKSHPHFVRKALASDDGFMVRIL